jgi:hypothetical protein
MVKGGRGLFKPADERCSAKRYRKVAPWAQLWVFLRRCLS